MAGTGVPWESPQADFGRQGHRTEGQIPVAGSHSHWRPLPAAEGSESTGGIGVVSRCPEDDDEGPRPVSSARPPGDPEGTNTSDISRLWSLTPEMIDTAPFTGGSRMLLPKWSRSHPAITTVLVLAVLGLALGACSSTPQRPERIAVGDLRAVQ